MLFKGRDRTISMTQTKGRNTVKTKVDAVQNTQIQLQMLKKRERDFIGD
jgi:hypothetical protein